MHSGNLALAPSGGGARAYLYKGPGAKHRVVGLRSLSAPTGVKVRG